MLVLDFNDVIAGKLAALAQRAASRDVYDGLSIMKIEKKLDIKSIFPALVASIATSNKPWEDPKSNATDYEIYKECLDLSRCLPRRYFRGPRDAVAWYKDSIAICREGFGGMLKRPGPGHPALEFVEGVQQRDEVRPELLDAPPDIRAGIASWVRFVWNRRNDLNRNITRGAPDRGGYGR